MSFKWFSDCHTVEELKKKYRRLAKQYHPDLGGDTKTMQDINAEYSTLFNLFTGHGKADYSATCGAEQQQATRDSSRGAYTGETAEDFIRMMNELLRIRGIKVEVCGSWIWVSGNTKDVREKLKELGLRWAPKKQMWYWKPADYKAKRHTGWSMDRIRDTYGSDVRKDDRDVA